MPSDLLMLGRTGLKIIGMIVKVPSYNVEDALLSSITWFSMKWFPITCCVREGISLVAHWSVKLLDISTDGIYFPLKGEHKRASMPRCYSPPSKF